MHVKVPPLKCQGIKTKLVLFILSQIQWAEQAHSKWIEPFLGSGVVLFNRAPQRALIADSNRHIIRLYQGIQTGEIDRDVVSSFLQSNGSLLLRSGAEYYYEVRDRFNQHASPLDFLFLNRACFNGLMRFNSKGGFNVPFCRKPQRFAPNYITKIANQVDWVAKQMAGKDWEFRVANWQETLVEAQPDDFVYLDPPYIGRHTDYYNAWGQTEAEGLATITKQLPCGFAVSMWLENQHRQNSHIQACWSDLTMRVCQHFYHVGARETLRGAIAEALLIKPGFSVSADQPLQGELGRLPHHSTPVKIDPS
jgi:DNA adenine methylase